MTLLSSDFESDASTNSATRPFFQDLYLTPKMVDFVKYFLIVLWVNQFWMLAGVNFYQLVVLLRSPRCTPKRQRRESSRIVNNFNYF